MSHYCRMAGSCTCHCTSTTIRDLDYLDGVVLAILVQFEDDGRCELRILIDTAVAAAVNSVLEIALPDTLCTCQSQSVQDVSYRHVMSTIYY